MAKYDLDTQQPFIASMVAFALDGLDGTPFAMNMRQKAKAQKVLIVKKPTGGASNISKASARKILINRSYWQIRNVQEGVYRNGHPCFEDKILDGHVYWNEYRLFDSNAKCGGMFIKTGDVDHGNLIQVLHEVSHYVQHTLRNSDRTKWPHMRKPHGEGFVQIYSRLRETFCNDPATRTAFIEKCKSMGFRKVA